MRLSSITSDESVLREIGARVARQRLERNLTQAQVAHEAGLAQRTVTRIEAGGTATVASLSASSAHSGPSSRSTTSSPNRGRVQWRSWRGEGSNVGVHQTHESRTIPRVTGLGVIAVDHAGPGEALGKNDRSSITGR
jgi:DNA-binding XRE family transcriptional regulator